MSDLWAEYGPDERPFTSEPFAMLTELSPTGA
jgi:hypothetical protein